MRPSLKNPYVLLATWFASGYAPKAPGTWGSLAALPFAWFIAAYAGSIGLIIAAAIVFLVGIVAADRYIALSGESDPAPVVVDEVAGQWLTLSLVPLDPLWFLAGFAAFRLFDIVKPWPIRHLERAFNKGFGVMIDDIAAAIYAGAVLWFVQVAGASGISG